MIPSVTTVLSPWSDFSMVPDHVLEAAAERGTRVHKACASIARGLWAPRPADIAGYIQSFDQWFNLIAEVVAVEAEFTCQSFGYMGHPDLVVRYHGDEALTVVDLKTPRAHLKTWNAQIAAYMNLVAVTLALPVERGGTLRLHPEGKRPIFDEIRPNERIRGLEAFMGSLTAWKYFKDGK